jgi:hypothetical protein
MKLRPLLVVAALLAPVAASALEARFDHRDLRGLVLEPLIAHDTVAVSGHATRSTWRPALRLAYGWDVLGEGNELFLGAQTALTGWSDPRREKVRLALDARYRSYFGTEQWKTFFELGVWAPVSSRFAIGPLLGLGVAYDFSRTSGLFVDGGFATGLGAARIASFSFSAGAAFRF